MFFIILKFEIHLIENDNVDYFRSNNSSSDIKIDERVCEKLLQHQIKKLYRDKIVKNFV